MSDEAWVDFVSGWISGGISVLACQPLDTVLTRMQANAGSIQPSASSLSASASSAAAASPLRPGVPTAHQIQTMGLVRGMVSDFGMSSLWRGSSAMIGAVPVQNALLMTGYGAGKRWSESSSSTSPSSSSLSGDTSSSNVLMGVFVGGCAGGVLQSFIMSPVELVKVTQQVVGESVTSATTTVFRGLFSPNGAWKGLGATLLRDGLPHGVWFASYEYAKTELTNNWTSNSTNNEGDDIDDDAASNNNNNSSSGDIAIPILSGAFAATTAWLVGYPADLIKTRIQAGSGKGIMGTAKDIMKESGGRSPLLGLYKGFSLKLFRAIPASSIGFLVYETVSSHLR